MDKLHKDWGSWENFAKWEYNSFFLETIFMALDYMINEGHNYPERVGSYEKWHDILEEMKEGFKLAQKRINHENLSEKEQKKIDKSFDLFKEYFFNLWD